MKTKKKIGIGILIILISIPAWMFIKAKFGLYSRYDIDDLSKENQEALAVFYGIHPEMISEGKWFDVKYTYFNELAPENGNIEIVKKTLSPIKDSDLIMETVIEKNDEKKTISMIRGNGSFDGKFTEKGKIYVRTILSGIFITMEPYERDTYKDFKLIIHYPGGSEEHKLSADVEKQLELNKEAMEKTESEKYLGELGYINIHSSYYFVNYMKLLYVDDFEAWVSRVEELLRKYQGTDKNIGIQLHMIAYDSNVPYDKAKILEKLLIQAYQEELIGKDMFDFHNWVECMDVVNNSTKEIDKAIYDRLLRKRGIEREDIEKLLENY